MINNKMRLYNYFLYEGKDAYGQETLSKEVKGSLKMAIYLTTQSVQDNINYHSANYIGFTYATPNDSYVIDYDGKKLKVLYVDTNSRFKQVYMSEL